MPKHDLRIIIKGSILGPSSVRTFQDWNKAFSINDLSPKFIIDAVQHEDYFPDFDEYNSIPLGLDLNDHKAIKTFFSSRPRSRLTISYIKEGRNGWKTSYTPSEFIKQWIPLIMDKSVSILEVSAQRYQLCPNHIYRLDSLDSSCLDWQLQTLNNTGWNCDWKEIGERVFQHPETKHKITF